MLQQKTSFLEKSFTKKIEDKIGRMVWRLNVHQDPLHDGKEEEDIAQPPKRRPHGRPGGVQESAEFAEYIQ